MSYLVIDLETTWSYKQKFSAGKWTEVSDKGSPFTQRNKVVAVGCYSPVENKYTLYDFDSGDNVKDMVDYVNKFKFLVGHNIKFDAHWLRHLGVDIKNMKLEDTLINEYILRRGEDIFAVLGLNVVAPSYGGTAKKDLVKTFWEAGCNTTDIPKSVLHEYLYLDVWNTYKVRVGQHNHPLFKKLLPMLTLNRDLNSVTQEMEYNGIILDTKAGEEIKQKFEQQLIEWERKVNGLLSEVAAPDRNINVGSSAQLAEALYGRIIPKENKDAWKHFYDNFNPFSNGADEQLKRAVLEHARLTGYGFKVVPTKDQITSTGFSASAEAMEALHKSGKLKGQAHEFVEAFMQYSKRQTWLNSNYWALVQHVSPDGAVHSSFNQAGTRTGRYSSNAPNLLNLPSRKKNGGENDIRRMVVSRFGGDGRICAPDFSQIELRVLFELSGSKRGIYDYENDIDIHTSKAKWAVDHYFGEGTWESGTDAERTSWRDEQKAVNFGLIYGLSPKDDLQKAMFDAFHNDYPEVMEWNKRVKDEILSRKYYQSPLTGMQYGFSRATHDNFYRGYDSRGRGWKNKSLNFPVQGDAGRICQVAMIGIYNQIKDNQDIVFLGQVYDQILLDVHVNALDKAKEICLNNMENVSELFEHYFGNKINVPIKVEWSEGVNWYECN